MRGNSGREVKRNLKQFYAFIPKTIQFALHYERPVEAFMYYFVVRDRIYSVYNTIVNSYTPAVCM